MPGAALNARMEFHADGWSGVFPLWEAGRGHVDGLDACGDACIDLNG